MNKLFPTQKTYCNPLPLPDYPRGGYTYDKSKKDYGWNRRHRHDFRETADPSVLYYENKWYLYSSCGQAYVSEDFITWEHRRIEPYNTYAPTIVQFREKFYLTACSEPLYRASYPLGPFQAIGQMELPKKQPLAGWGDPMLFADDDGTLYAYWGCGGPGIFGARLDPEHPTRLLTDPVILFGYNPDHKWERFGDFNEDISKSYVEGPWMFKHNGRYYLTYTAPGTEWRTYGMGCYISDRPLGPFRYQSLNPILKNTEGLVHGPGHGCIVRGPGDTLWAFYTCLSRREHNFERRIGMDPAGIDAGGNLFVRGSSETPQWAPGLLQNPEKGNDARLLPVTVNKPVIASSEKEGRDPLYALDNGMRTWWESEPGDRKPWLEVDLLSPFNIQSLRILWAEPGLDYDGGALPEPSQYMMEVCADTEGKNWKIALDRSTNQKDMLVEYQTFPEVVARKVRLTVTNGPQQIGVGIVSFTVFGRPLE